MQKCVSSPLLPLPPGFSTVIPREFAGACYCMAKALDALGAHSGVDTANLHGYSDNLLSQGKHYNSC